VKKLEQHTLNEIISQVKEGYHPSDLLPRIEQLEEEEKKELFNLLSDEEAADIVKEMEEYDQVSLLRILAQQKAAGILSKMAVDDAADVIGQLSPEEAREFLSLIGEEAEEIKGLLKYPHDTAGGIMTTEYIALHEDIPAEEAILRLRGVAPDAEIIYYVYVVDAQTRLTGVLSLRELIAAEDGTPLREIMFQNVVSVPAKMDQEEVAKVVARYDLMAVPVVDQDNRLLGIITVDDIIDVIEEEATEDIYRLTGTGELEGVNIFETTVYTLARKRLPWLFVSLVGGLISGSVIGAYENTLEAVVILAAFIPVIMDMGGNVGTQSSTLFVRSLATGEVQQKDVWRYLMREIQVGLTIGVVNGIVIALAASIWQGIPLLGVVVGGSMFATIILAALIGTLIPIIFNHLGIDPAITAGPFVTTIKDVTGLLIYFSIATAFMEYLG